MRSLDPRSFVDRVSVYTEDDSDEPPVLEIPPVVLDFTSDDVWDAFSDFSGDIAEFDLPVEEFEGGTLPDDLFRLVISDDETLGDGGNAPSSIDNSDTVGRILEVLNAFDNPDPALAWRLANMPDDVLLTFEVMDFELEDFFFFFFFFF